MKSKRIAEIICGIIVILIALFFLMYSYIILYKRSISTYTIIAIFNEVGGLYEGSSVIIKGVKVGFVYKVYINNNNNVEVLLNIDDDIKIPLDSKVIIKDTDLFSGRKVEIVPGSSNVFAKNYSIMTNTQGYIYLEDKISNIIFSSK